MNARAFEVIDAINREGLDNSNWGLCQDVEDTSWHFGIEESRELKGTYAYVYIKAEDYEYSFLKGYSLITHTQ